MQISRTCALNLILLCAAICPCCLADRLPDLPQAPNPGFEMVDTKLGFAEGWTRGFGQGTHASAEIDDRVYHSGKQSLRISDSTATSAYHYAIVNSDWIAVAPSTTYRLRFWARGRAVGKFMVGAGFAGGGEYRESLPVGDYEWQEISVRLTTPAACTRLTLQFVADGVTDALWLDDVRLERSEVQEANLVEVRSPHPSQNWFPRTPGPLPDRLVVADISKSSADVCAVLTALQGIVNRTGPRLYLINPTNPVGYDSRWLTWLQHRGYTGPEELLANPLEAIGRFRDRIRGAIVWDPAIPGTVNGAWMLAGIKNGLPCSPNMAIQLKLPVMEDLRNRWRRNVDVYRYVFDKYWPVMSHDLLAWEYPGSSALSSRDYMVQHRVFMFWASAPLDKEPGADPAAEMEFIEHILGCTPGNVPVMGWPQYGGTRGIEEYTAVRLLSEYGKWVPGTGYNSNVSVHSAINPPATAFRQSNRTASINAPLHPDSKTAYVSINIMDSGDAQWYWQFYQQLIWADPTRGTVPTGYGMNVTMLDTLPAVAEWYYQNRAPGDSFFGLIYMNAPVYASRFRPADRERIWADFVRRFDSYRKRLDMDGIEIYNGSTSGPSASEAVFKRYVGGMKGLKYILADLGRHTDTTPEHSASILNGTVIFHTMTNFRVWSSADEVLHKTMESENRWLSGEIVGHTPSRRPAFVTALAISWYYYPTWMKDLVQRLPADYRAVSPGDLARLFMEGH